MLCKCDSLLVVNWGRVGGSDFLKEVGVFSFCLILFIFFNRSVESMV